MKEVQERFSVRALRASKGFLRSKVGSRTSSLGYVAVASVLCLALAFCGYLRRDGAPVQFARVTTNTGLSFEHITWTPTSLVITNLNFNPNRNDPDEHKRNMPGKLFDSLDSARVESVQVQWGWSFLPTPTAITVTHVEPKINTQKLQDTLKWLKSLPKGSPRTFAVDLQDVRPTLTDWKNDRGEAINLPPFGLTLGPEVNGDFAYNLVMVEPPSTSTAAGASAGARMSFRVTYDGHGATYLNAGNCRLERGTWSRLRELLHRNAADHAWWLKPTDLSDPVLAWVDEHELQGDFNLTAAAFKDGDHLRALEADAAVTDLQYRPFNAAEGCLQEVNLHGTVAAHAQYDRLRGSFQIDLGAGNRVDLGFDRPVLGTGDVPPPGTPPVLMPWEGWLERNQTVTSFRLAGSYRYLVEYERPAGALPGWLSLLPAELRRPVMNTFACTQLEGAEIRAGLADGAELRMFAGQPDMQQYKASVTVRAPRTGPSAGAWVQADFSLGGTDAPPAVPGTGTTRTGQPPPIKFDIMVYTDRFPVPGQKTMFYTGKFELNQCSITRVWIDQLLLDRNLNVAFTPLPWLDLLNRQESMRIGDFRVIDGRLIETGEHPFFVRNGNLHGVVTFKSLEPFNGSLTIQELTGAQTGFGEHTVEFGPEKLSGLMEFNLGYLTRAGMIDAWQNRAYDLDPENLFAVHLQSNVPNQPAWQFHFVLPWYMTRGRPGMMKAIQFPARLYPPGVNPPGSSLQIDAQAPIDWEMECWLEPANVGEGALAPASLCALPENNAAAAARVAQALAFTGLPGKRLLIVKRNLSAPNIAVKSADQFEAEGLNLPSMGDTKYYPFPRE